MVVAEAPPGSTEYELGFGTAGVGNLYRAVSEANALRTLKCAVENGLTYWDTAPFYGLGLAEYRIGRFISDAGWNSTRLSTKVGRLLEPSSTDNLNIYGFEEPCANRPVFDYSAKGVEQSLKSSFERLGVSSIDTVYFHDLGRLTHGVDHQKHWRIALDEGLPVLERLKANGTIGKIGIGANETAVLRDALATGAFDCFLLAGRYTLFEHQDSLAFLNDCHANGVTVSIGGPFNSGLLATRPDANSRYNYETAARTVVERAQALWDVCARFNVSAATAAIQFAGAHPAVTQVLAGGQTPAHVKAIALAGKESVPNELWAALRREGFIIHDAPTPASARAG